MVKKWAKVLFYAILLGIVFSIVTFAWYYVQSYLVLRSSIGEIAIKVSAEGCLAKEKVYKNGNQYYSVQDYVKSYIDTVDNASWFLEFNTSNLVGGENSNSAVSVYYTSDSGVITADSYLNAAVRGTTVTITLRGTYKITLRYAPEVNGEKLTINMPVSYTLRVLTSSYYKGTDDNREY